MRRLPRTTFSSQRWRTPALATGLALVLVVLAHGGGTTGGGEATGPLPFDPLSAEEQTRALDAARADPRVAEELGRHEAIGAALNTDKHRMRVQPDARMADVWFYAYDTDRTVQALVEVREGRVAAIEVTDTWQPPITAREVAHAGALALADPEVAGELEARQPHEEVDTTARLWTGSGATACPVHRCALVAFFLDGAFQPDLFVRVNLSLDEVEGIVRHGDLDGGDHHEEVRL